MSSINYRIFPAPAADWGGFGIGGIGNVALDFDENDKLAERFGSFVDFDGKGITDIGISGITNRTGDQFAGHEVYLYPPGADFWGG